MFTMYKGDMECTADDRQEINMKKAGWSRTKPVAKEAPKPVATKPAAKPASGSK